MALLQLKGSLIEDVLNESEINRPNQGSYLQYDPLHIDLVDMGADF